MQPFHFCGLTFNADDQLSGSSSASDPDCLDAEFGEVGLVSEMEAFIRLAKNKKCLVDVGAQFGIFSFVFTTINDGSTAYAIEGSDQAIPILEKNILGNPKLNISCIPLFVGDNPGREVKCMRSWVHVIANESKSGYGYVVLKEQCIDDIGIEFCDIMKIDVEGYECQVLRGACELIERCHPLIFLECHLGVLPVNGEDAVSLTGILDDLGYSIFKYDGITKMVLTGGNTRVLCIPKHVGLA